MKGILSKTISQFLDCGYIGFKHDALGFMEYIDLKGYWFVLAQRDAERHGIFMFVGNLCGRKAQTDFAKNVFVVMP